MLVEFINYSRLVLYRYSSDSYIYDGSNRKLRSKTSDMFSFIYTSSNYLGFEPRARYRYFYISGLGS